MELFFGLSYLKNNKKNFLLPWWCQQSWIMKYFFHHKVFHLFSSISTHFVRLKSFFPAKSFYRIRIFLLILYLSIMPLAKTDWKRTVHSIKDFLAHSVTQFVIIGKRKGLWQFQTNWLVPYTEWRWKKTCQKTFFKKIFLRKKIMCYIGKLCFSQA